MVSAVPSDLTDTACVLETRYGCCQIRSSIFPTHSKCCGEGLSTFLSHFSLSKQMLMALAFLAWKWELVFHAKAESHWMLEGTQRTSQQLVTDRHPPSQYMGISNISPSLPSLPSPLARLLCERSGNRTEYQTELTFSWN